MSSPVRQSEIGAPAARVSRSHGGGSDDDALTSGSTTTSAAPPDGRSPDRLEQQQQEPQPYNNNTHQADLPLPSRDAAQDAQPLPNPAATPPYPYPPAAQAQPSAPLSAAPADDIKTRASRPIAASSPSSGPNGTQRHTGPSLLSQALASARGIPSKPASGSQPTTESPEKPAKSAAAQPQSIAQSQSQSQPHPQPQPNDAQQQQTQPQPRRDPSALSTRPDDPRTSHGERTGAVTQTQRSASQRPEPSTMAAPAAVTAAPTTTMHNHDAASGTSSFDHHTITQIRESLLEHRDFLDRTRDRASTSLDIERGSYEITGDYPFSYSTSPDELTTPTSAYYFDRTSPAKPKDGQPRRPDARMPEHRYTVGPEKTEKVWSIGAKEGSEEDGLVEKSVAEAMAGVEPNARSRKASYSLRFFKEGLPHDDKPRRRDTKSGPRDKLEPTAEESNAQASSSASRSVAGETRPKDAEPPVELEKKHTTDVGIEPPVETDYFNSRDAEDKGDETPIVRAIVLRPGDAVEASSAPPLNVGPSRQRTEGDHGAPDTPNLGERRSTPGSPDAEADESGEEKISSAVFVPHHEAGEARTSDDKDPDSSHPQRPRALSQSKSWLVKADDPDSDAQPKEDFPPYELSNKRSRENLVSRRVDIEIVQVDDRSGDKDLEAKSSKSPSKPVRSATIPNDVVTEQQGDATEQPLEAIELIPYKHQVGGHTTLWRFSKRAVCKQLNNRENEFYETIERYHRDLLPFLPRYVYLLKTVVPSS